MRKARLKFHTMQSHWYNFHWKDWCWSCQYRGHLMRRAYSWEKTLMLGKTEGKRRSGQQGRRWLDSITDSLDMSLSQLQETVKDQEAHADHGVPKSQTRLGDWTTFLKWKNGRNEQQLHGCWQWGRRKTGRVGCGYKTATWGSFVLMLMVCILPVSMLTYCLWYWLQFIRDTTTKTGTQILSVLVFITECSSIVILK